MVISFLKRMMGGGAKSAPAAAAPVPAAAATGGECELSAFVEYVAKSLVDKPESVRVSVTAGDRDTTTIQISCEKRDIGKIIGKNGKTIAAIRALANGAAGRSGRRVNVEVLD